jgi:CRP-like cAMP-binding protein
MLRESVMFDTSLGPYLTEGYSPKGLSMRNAVADACRQNRMLSALLTEERARLLPNMQRIPLTVGQVIYESGTRLDFAYLPTTSIVSSIYTTQEGATAQMALIGNEGMAGIELFLDRDTAHYRTVVLIAGEAIRASSKALQAEFARGGAFQHSILRYTNILLTQLSQTAICNRLHSVEQRLCRWLLECDDRVSRNEIQMTQENIANMLGVRREGVTVAAGRLQEAGLIQYSRGHIHILDRDGLEAIACECYRVVGQEVNCSPASAHPRQIAR